MESEGPYRTGDATCIVFRVGVGEAENFDSERDALNASRLANTAYAEGRKAAKKDLHYDELSLKYLVDRHESLVDDFKELLEWANDMAHEGRMTHNIEDLAERFYAWKKARGIE